MCCCVKAKEPETSQSPRRLRVSRGSVQVKVPPRVTDVELNPGLWPAGGRFRDRSSCSVGPLYVLPLPLLESPEQASPTLGDFGMSARCLLLRMACPGAAETRLQDKQF